MPRPFDPPLCLVPGCLYESDFLQAGSGIRYGICVDHRGQWERSAAYKALPHPNRNEPFWEDAADDYWAKYHEALLIWRDFVLANPASWRRNDPLF